MRPFTALAGLLYAQFVTGCGSVTNTGIQTEPSLARRTVVSVKSSQFDVRHLYISSAPQQTPQVFEYPIVKGIAATKPDATLNVASPAGKTPSIAQIRIDPNGNLAVLVNSDTQSQVDFYAPGSTGKATPSGILALPPAPNLVTDLAFDPQANIYIALFSQSAESWGYNVYAAGSTGSASALNSFLIYDLHGVVFAGSTLYGFAGTVTTYANAFTDPTPLNEYCPNYPHNGKLHWFNTGPVAIDQASSRVFLPQSYELKSGESRIAIFPVGKTRCPARVEMEERPANPPGGRFLPTAIAYFDNYLYVADTYNGLTYQLPAAPGKQNAAATLHKAGAIAIGP